MPDRNFSIIRFSVKVRTKSTTHEGKKSWDSICEASVKVSISKDDGKRTIEYKVADGDGPVNALDNALKKCLIDHFPFLKNIHLINFRVNILGGEGTASSVIVYTVFSGYKKRWETSESSTDIINASFHAIVDAYRKVIFELNKLENISH